jgi:hypothetical protein
MRHRTSVLPYAVLAAAALSTYAAPVGAADAISGSASLNAQTVALAHGFGVWSAKTKSASIGLFAKAPGAAQTATALDEGIDSAFGVREPANGAYVLLKLGFPAGAPRADHLNVCEIDFYNFADSPEQTMWLGNEQCGVIELSGDLRPGGVVHGKLKGTSTQTTGKKYTWDLAFTATLQAGK